MKSFIASRSTYFWLILITSIILLASHTAYILQTNQQPEMDEQHYMDMGSTFYRMLKSPTLTTPVDMLQHIPYRQPGYSLFFLPLLLIFGISYSYAIALFANGLFYIATIIGVYFLGKEFFSKKSAYLASIVFACYGWPLFYLHFTYSETATSCLILLCVLFLKKSNSFSVRKYALLFGIFLGLGLLTRWVTVIFIAGPLLISIILIIAHSRKKRKQAFMNLLLSIGLGTLIACPPYIANQASFFGYYVKDQALGGALWDALPSSKKSFISLQSFSYYLKVFEQLTLPIFSLFIAGLSYIVFKKKKYIFLLAAFLAPYLIFSFATIIKDDRYIVPIYPFIALISLSFLDAIKKVFIKTVLIGLILLLSIGNFLGGTWGIGPLGVKGLASTLIPMPIGHPRMIHWTTIVWPPRKEVSNARKILEIIDKNADSKKDLKVTQLFSYHPVDIGIYSLNTYMREDKIVVENFVGSAVTNPKASSEYVVSTIASSDFLLIKDINKVDSYFPPVNYVLLNATIKALSNSTIPGYTKVGSVKIPADQSTVTVYKRVDDMSSANQKDIKDQLVKKLLTLPEI